MGAKRSKPERRPGTLGQERAAQAAQRIHRKIKGSGRGRLTELEKKLKYNHGYLTQLKSTGDIRLSVLYELADEFGIPIEVLLDEDEPEISPVGPKPAFLDLLITPNGEGVPESVFQTIDKQRYWNPRNALSDLFSAASLASPGQAVNLLSLAAGCYVQMYNFSSSSWAIESAIKIGPSRADVLLRKVNLLLSLALNRQAKRLLERAKEFAVENHDLTSLGVALGTEGYMMSNAKAWSAARNKFLAALKYSDKLLPRKLSGIYQGLAVGYAAELQFDQARTHLDEALQFAREADNPEFVAKTVWSMATTCESPSDAILKMEEALNLFPEHCYIDRALALIDLVHLFVSARKIYEARTCAGRALGLLEGLGFIPEAEKAIAQLALSRCVEKENLESIGVAVAKARARFARAQFGILPMNLDRSTFHNRFVSCLPDG